jgi:hypothetical protein
MEEVWLKRGAPETLRLLGAGIVLWLVAFLVLQLVNVPGLPLRRTVGTYAGAASVTSLITALGAYLPPPTVVAGLTLVFLVLLVLDIYSWEIGQHGGARKEGAQHPRNGPQ